MLEDDNRVLSRIAPHDLVLDVGGWACPFNRADWVIDAEPYETRGYYSSIGLPRSQGGEKEHFSRDTGVRRALCAREPWPFSDKQFNYSICSHTLEDLRDPLFVCSELIRVSRAGYIEVPSRLWETCRGVEHPRMAGLSHHRWLIERDGNHLQFTQKFHCLHAEFDFSLPPAFAKYLSLDDSVLRFYWTDAFAFSEVTIHGTADIYAWCAHYVSKRHRYPRAMNWTRAAVRLAHRVGKGMLRRIRAL